MAKTPGELERQRRQNARRKERRRNYKRRQPTVPDPPVTHAMQIPDHIKELGQRLDGAQ